MLPSVGAGKACGKEPIKGSAPTDTALLL